MKENLLRKPVPNICLCESSQYASASREIYSPSPVTVRGGLRPARVVYYL